MTPSRTSILGAVKNFKKTGNVTFVDPRKGIKSAKRVGVKNQLVPILEGVNGHNTKLSFCNT